VLNPTGVAGGNVFTDWPSLYAAGSQVPGGVRVEFVGNVTIPAAASPYNIDGWQWVNGSSAAVVTIADGAHATWQNLWIDALTVVGNNTTPFFTATAGANLYIKDGAVIQSTSTGPFVESTGSGFVFVTASEAFSIGDGTVVTFAASGAGATHGDVPILVRTADGQRLHGLCRSDGRAKLGSIRQCSRPVHADRRDLFLRRVAQRRRSRSELERRCGDYCGHLRNQCQSSQEWTGAT
jgi:hypothetical protein